MKTPGGVPPDVWTALIDGLTLNRYDLLLGAGFSRDVKDRSGQALPDGPQMAEELVREFGLDARSGELADLGRLYRSAGRSRSTTGLVRDEWLKRRFTQTNAPSWYSLLEISNWPSIWTLNIDDAVERAMKGRVDSIHYADPPIDPRRNAIPLIHLHGKATDTSKGLVFSIDEYRQSISNPRSWAVRFDEQLADGPFVILGAALHHEFDLVSALNKRAKNLSAEYPTIAAMPSPSALDREDFLEWNIQIFDGTAEEFLLAARDAVSTRRTELLSDSEEAPQETPLRIRFLEQWREVSKVPRTRYHNYPAGDEPEWSDIESGLVVQRRELEEVVAQVIKGRPIVLHGPPFAGKSSVALGVAQHLRKQGWSAWIYEDSIRPDIDAVLHRLREHPRTLLVVEEASSFARDIDILAERALELGVKLALIAIDRDGPVDRLVSNPLLTSLSVTDRPTRTELSEILQQLVRRGLVSDGDVARNPEKHMAQFLSTSDPTIGALIARFVFGTGFEDRVRRDYRSITSDEERRIALAAAICSRVGRGGSIGVLAAALGMTSRDLEATLDNSADLSEILRNQGGHIRARSRLFADLLTQQVVVGREIQPVIHGLCIAIAPQLSPRAVSTLSWSHRLSTYLLDQDRLAGMIGRPNLEDFYQSVESAFAWTSRFWEQRALAASHDQMGASAIRFALEAVRRHRDSYSLNTLATVRLRAIEYTSANSGVIDEQFESALHDLREARKTARTDSEHPFVTFFTHMLTYGRFQFQRDGQISPRSRHEWQDWWLEAQSSSAFSKVGGDRALKGFQRDWLMVGTASRDRRLP